MFCNECGHENRNDRKFCAECGKPLKDYTKPIDKEKLLMPEDIENEKQKAEKRNNITKVTGIIFWCLFVSAIILTIASFLTKDGVQLTLISIATACYVAMLVVFIVKKSLFKKLNKDKTQKVN